jgi:hypothetical protein
MINRARSAVRKQNQPHFQARKGALERAFPGRVLEFSGGCRVSCCVSCHVSCRALAFFQLFRWVSIGSDAPHPATDADREILGCIECVVRMFNNASVVIGQHGAGDGCRMDERIFKSPFGTPINVHSLLQVLLMPCSHGKAPS